LDTMVAQKVPGTELEESLPLLPVGGSAVGEEGRGDEGLPAAARPELNQEPGA